MIRRNGIDLFRLIAALFIMILHADYKNLNQEYAAYIQMTGRWVVPFFFITSGFFIGEKIKSNNGLTLNSIEKNLAQLIKILIISSLVFLPISIATNQISLKLNYIILGTAKHLWFISSLLFGYIIIWLLYYSKQEKLLFPLSILIFIFCLFTDSYYIFFMPAIDNSIAILLISIPLLYIGIKFAEKDIRINKFMPILFILLGIIIQQIESQFFFIKYDIWRAGHFLQFGILLIAIGMFLLALKLNPRNNLLSSYGKDYSLFIYLYHPISYCFLSYIFSFYLQGIYAILTPLIGFAITLSASYILERYFKKIFAFLTGRKST